MTTSNGPVTGQRSATRPRWGIMMPFRVGAYMDRLRLVQTPWFGLYLHVIRKEDLDPDPHNHPWAFWSLILSGGYTERVWDAPGTAPGTSRYVTYRRGDLHFMSRRGAHRIIQIEGLLWTLVVTGPKRGTWGWWVNLPQSPELVPWHVYRGVADIDQHRHERTHLWGS